MMMSEDDGMLEGTRQIKRNGYHRPMTDAIWICRMVPVIMSYCIVSFLTRA